VFGAKRLDDVPSGLKDEPLIVLRQAPALAIALRMIQRRHNDLIVGSLHGASLHVFVHDVRRLFGILRKQALIVTDIRLHRRLIGQ
jgi:hypothetical protein